MRLCMVSDTIIPQSLPIYIPIQVKVNFIPRLSNSRQVVRVKTGFLLIARSAF